VFAVRGLCHPAARESGGERRKQMQAARQHPQRQQSLWKGQLHMECSHVCVSVRNDQGLAPRAACKAPGQNEKGDKRPRLMMSPGEGM